MRKNRNKNRNPVKKFMEIVNKPKVFTDRKKEVRNKPLGKIEINIDDYEDYDV